MLHKKKFLTMNSYRADQNVEFRLSSEHIVLSTFRLLYSTYVRNECTIQSTIKLYLTMPCQVLIKLTAVIYSCDVKIRYPNIS